MDSGSGSRQAKRGQERTPGRGFWSLEHVVEWQPGGNGGGISPSPPRFCSAKNHPLGSESTEDRHWPLLLLFFQKPVLTLQVTDRGAASTLQPLWQAGEGVEVSVSAPDSPLLQDQLVGDGTFI